LIGDVAQNCRFGDRPARACEAEARPQGSKTAAKVRKFLAQRVAGERLKLSGKLRNRPTRISLNKKVNVIGHNFQPATGPLLFQEFSQTFFDGIYQNRAAILSGSKPM
jgi:hypothetical protein